MCVFYPYLLIGFVSFSKPSHVIYVCDSETVNKQETGSEKEVAVPHLSDSTFLSELRVTSPVSAQDNMCGHMLSGNP